MAVANINIHAFTEYLGHVRSTFMRVGEPCSLGVHQYMSVNQS